MKINRTSGITILVSWLLVYFSGKLLFDAVPYVFELFSLALFGFCSLFFLRSKAAADRYSLKLFLLFFVFAGYVLLNGFVQSSFSQLARSVYEYILYMLIFFAMLWLLPRANLRIALKVFAWWGLLIALLTWVEFFTQTLLIAKPVANYLSFRAIVFSRSFLSHGTILGIFSLVCMDICYREKKPLWFLAGIFCFASILATASRGPLVACGAGLVIQFFMDAFISRRHSVKRFAACCALLLAAVAFFALMFGDFLTGQPTIDNFLLRIRSIFNWTGEAGNAGRLDIWELSLEWWKTNIWFGIGPSHTGSWSTSTIGVTESGLLKRLVELGIIGFVIFYSFLASVFARAISAYRKKAPAEKKQMVLWFSMAISILINDITLQCTEEIMISFFLWTSLAAIGMPAGYGAASHRQSRLSKHEEEGTEYDP